MPVAIPAGPSKTCRDAIRRYWPKNLWEQAFVVLDRENGSELPTRVGQNKDAARSKDNGCMQINDYWHFGTKGWTVYSQIFDPDFNAQYAYKIYQGRKANGGNGWTAWYGARGIYWQ